MSNQQKTEEKESVENTTTDYDNATLEEKVEGIAYWMHDALTDILDVVKAIKKDHYESEDDVLDAKLQSVEDSIGYLAEIRNTLESI